MVHYVAPEDQTFGMECFLDFVGSGLDGRVRVHSYRELINARTLPVGSYIFSAIDQLAPVERHIVARWWQLLSDAGTELHLLNHPHHVLLRYGLLASAFAAGRNHFRAWRVAELPAAVRFPVFVRLENEHIGSLTGLLYTPAALYRALAGLWLRGYRPRDLLIVEYCHTADEDGVFRRYSAFIVGKVIVPSFLVCSRQWATKHEGAIVEDATVREEMDYVERNPHETWLRETFAMAGTDYGRVDYGLCHGEPQVWEINLNPTILVPRTAQSKREAAYRLRTPVRMRCTEDLAAAFAAVDSGGAADASIAFEVTPRELRHLAAARNARCRMHARRRRRAQVAGLPPISWLRGRPRRPPAGA